MRNLLRAISLRKIALSSVLTLGLLLSACGGAQVSGDEAEAAWVNSAHGDQTSPAFTNWDDDDPAEIPENCAKCHSTPGYHDYLGFEGSAANQVDGPAPVGTTVECDACHNEAAAARQMAIMPSGIEISGLGTEANCMECHQGRASSLQLAGAIADLPRDTVEAELKMPGIHSNPVAALLYGGEARGGGEYPGAAYDAKFQHNADTCVTCHDPHALQLRVLDCAACHLGANTLEGVRDIRLTRTDYDGDGDIAEGLSGEIETMQEILLASLQLRAAGTPGADPLTFDGRFVDQNGDSYATWTPRLLQAAYNYQYVSMDPGSYAHHPQYALQLLYDSIEDLGGSTRGMTRPSAE